MAQKASTSARIVSLEAAKRRISAMDDERVLTSTPMADALGVAWNTLRGWCNTIPAFEGSGAFVRGGNGIEWEFDPHKTVDTLLRHFRDDRDRRQDQNRSFVKNIGLEIDPEEAGQIDLADLSRQGKMTVDAFKHKVDSGEYSRRSDFVSVVSEIYMTVRDSELGLRSHLDPTGLFSPEQVKAIEDYQTSRILVLKEKISRRLGGMGAHLIEERTVD